MKRQLSNIYHLGIKELFSLRRDYVLLFMIVWAFSISVYVAAASLSHNLHNASIGIVDEDVSTLSRRIRGAFFAPRFREPELISFSEIDAGMDLGTYTFTLVIPSGFEADTLNDRRPALQLNIDATAMMQAGIGASYIRGIIQNEVMRFMDKKLEDMKLPVELQTRIAFNPNLTSDWFTSIMQILNSVTMLTVLLTGAALIREREHSTIEHLLVMPLSPFEIIMAKVWANGAVVLVSVIFSLLVIVKLLLGVPIAGSILLFLVGTVLYLFFACALGVFLATIVRSMPQFGLLFMLVMMPMMMLSGSHTPIESQPYVLRTFMQLVPSTHFVNFAQAILYRGAGLVVVWPQFLMVAVIGIIFFVVTVLRFRRSVTVLTG